MQRKRIVCQLVMSLILFTGAVQAEMLPVGYMLTYHYSLNYPIVKHEPTFFELVYHALPFTEARRTPFQDKDILCGVGYEGFEINSYDSESLYASFEGGFDLSPLAPFKPCHVLDAYLFRDGRMQMVPCLLSDLTSLDYSYVYESKPTPISLYDTEANQMYFYNTFKVPESLLLDCTASFSSPLMQHLDWNVDMGWFDDLENPFSVVYLPESTQTTKLLSTHFSMGEHQSGILIEDPKTHQRIMFDSAHLTRKDLNDLMYLSEDLKNLANTWSHESLNGAPILVNNQLFGLLIVENGGTQWQTFNFMPFGDTSEPAYSDDLQLGEQQFVL